MKNNFMNKLSRVANGVVFQAKKYSPEILLGLGIIGGIGSAVLACKETLKLNDILEEHNNTLDAIKKVSETEELKEKYDENTVKHDIIVTYKNTIIDVTKLYAPSIVLGGLSIASVLASNNIIKKRNLALAAAYTAIDKSFKEYRNRVVEKFGSDVDKELRYGAVKKDIIEATVNEDGTTTTTVKTANVSTDEYTVYFDKTTSCYATGIDDYDLMFLRSQESYATDRLKVTGYITLDDIISSLGIEPNDFLKKAGMVVGWRYDESDPEIDNCVSFNITETYREISEGEFIPSFALDFNVDGNIYNKM